MIITIDGPSVSGKSTVARQIAKRLHLYYIASGMLFRSLAYLLMEKYGYTPTTVDHATDAEITALLAPERFAYTYDAVGEHIFFDGLEITTVLKNSDIDTGASVVATSKIARDALLQFQRTLAHANDCIIDGRDCGSVVFPHADFKFFLTASIDVRAQRWQTAQAILGNIVTTQEAETFVAARDQRDATREVDPLVIPQGAKIVDNSNIDQDETANLIIAYISHFFGLN